jgi:fibronectin type 3 domain-containing protein
LLWTSVSSPSVIGYRVYYGTAPGAYAQARGAGLYAATATYTVTGLTAGRTYYFVVTSVDATGNESTYSNEASKLIQ